MRNSTLGGAIRLTPFATLAASIVLGSMAIADGPSNPYDMVDLDCTEFNRYEVLTPNDTLSLITSAHNPDQARGFVVVYAVDAAGEAISFNHLVGAQMVINGIANVEYSINPVDFRSPVADGGMTDVDGDGIRDLDDVEYETAPNELLVPRFIGQSSMDPDLVPGPFHGELILVDLNSGSDFDTTVDFLTYNDNEEVFSAEYTFSCWDNPRLLDISGVYSDYFLKNATGHDENESIAGREAGWFRFQGALANSTAATIADPAIYGVYIERVAGYAAADLPFEIGSRDGHILPRTIFGDNSEGSGFVGDGEAAVQRRKPGSLMVYPEFNNLMGDLTLLTITNVNPSEEVRVHFVYYGKQGFAN